MDIAVIGGGATGISAIDAILHNSRGSQFNITLYEGDKGIGPGRAYQGDGDYALLNRQSDLMSIRTHEPTHFSDWMKRQYGEGAALNQFPPRHVFGRYLTSCLTEHVQQARQRGTPLTIVSEFATGAFCDRQGVTISTASGDTKKFDAAILCIGTAEPVDVFGLSAEPHFISEPYPVWVRCAGLPQEKHIGILGSSLTAVDTVLGLKAQGHYGPITLFSRRGLLPAVRHPHHRFEFQHFNEGRIRRLKRYDGYLSVEDIPELFKEEAAAQGVPFDDLIVEFSQYGSPITRLDRHLQQIHDGSPWQSLFIQIVNEHVETLWQNIIDGEKRLFLQNYHSLFMSLTNPMPPSTGSAIRSLMASGQLACKSNVRNVVPHVEGGFTVECGSETSEIDVLINTTRPDTGGIGRVGRSIVGALIASGAAQAHPFGGLKIEPSTHRLIRRDGTPNANLYAAGQLTCGDLYYTGSLYRSTVHVDRLVASLMQQENVIEKSYA